MIVLDARIYILLLFCIAAVSVQLIILTRIIFRVLKEIQWTQTSMCVMKSGMLAQDNHSYHIKRMVEGILARMENSRKREVRNNTEIKNALKHNIASDIKTHAELEGQMQTMDTIRTQGQVSNNKAQAIIDRQIDSEKRILEAVKKGNKDQQEIKTRLTASRKRELKQLKK